MSFFFLLSVGVAIAAGLTVGLQQLLLGGDGERAVFCRQHDRQADIVLLRGRGPAHHSQQSHRVRLRSSAEALYAKPGGVAQARWRRKQALPWRQRGRKRRRRAKRAGECHSSFNEFFHCCDTVAVEVNTVTLRTELDAGIKPKMMELQVQRDTPQVALYRCRPQFNTIHRLLGRLPSVQLLGIDFCVSLWTKGSKLHY